MHREAGRRGGERILFLSHLPASPPPCEFSGSLRPGRAAGGERPGRRLPARLLLRGSSGALTLDTGALTRGSRASSTRCWEMRRAS